MPIYGSRMVCRSMVAVPRFLLGLCLGAAACAPVINDMRMGTPRAPREPTCSLDIVPPTDLATIQKYEQVGIVHLSHEEAGTDPMAPSARELVRPRACAMGGEAISIMASGNILSPALTTSAFGAYLVWAKKPSPSAAPQKF
jgi:hypothetical protein